MAETAFRGPVLSLGATLDTSSSPFDGPSISYQGQIFPDPRENNPAAKDSFSPGAIPGFLIGNTIQVIDQIPSPLSTTTIAATQVATSGTAFSLATTAAGGSASGVPSWCVGIPIIPSGTTTVTHVGAIDFGFTTGTTTANSSTVVVLDSTMFAQGQWLVIGGAGNAALTTSLITQVASVVNATTIQISPVAVGALSHAPIGQGNLFNNNLPPGTQLGPSAASASAAVPYRVAGFGLAFDPVQSMTRSLTIQAASLQGGTATIVVTGYDIYNRLMTELFTCSGTTQQVGQKAFKYISSVTPSATGSSVYTVGISDVVGIPLRTDRFGNVRVTMGTGVMVTSAGFTAAITAVATNTTGDVRGALVINTLGGALMTSNGTGRLNVVVTVPLQAVINATPGQATSLLGVPQA